MDFYAYMSVSCKTAFLQSENANYQMLWYATDYLLAGIQSHTSEVAQARGRNLPTALKAEPV